MLRPDDLVERMAALGFSAEEAQVYVRLTMAGPSKASDVATLARLRRPEAYRVLQALVQRGAVLASLGRPTRFEAVPPEELFRAAFKAQETAWEDMASAEKELVPALQQLRGQATGEATKATLRVVQGRSEGQRILLEALREAKKDILLVSTGPPASLGGSAEVWDLARRRAEAGLRVRAIAHEPPRAGAALEARWLTPGEPLQFAVADAEELVWWAVLDPSTRLRSEHDVVIHARSPGVAAPFRLLFERLWAEAKAQGPK